MSFADELLGTIPRQPATPEGPYELQRPTPEEIRVITDPYGDRQSVLPSYLDNSPEKRAHLIVLNRYRAMVPHSNPERRDRGHTEPSKDTWGHYHIHGDTRPTLFKTWHRAKAQALGKNNIRPGAILLFDLGRLPVVTSEEEMITVLKRPIVEDYLKSGDHATPSEYEIAERMVDAWAKYAASLPR